MNVYHDLDFRLKDTAVCLGKFDGMHSGHRMLASAVLEKKAQGLLPSVFTFDVLDTGKHIYTQSEKEGLLERMGFEEVVSLPFLNELKTMSAEDFIKEILISRMDAKFIAAGRDFHFGYERKGSVHTLREYSVRYGYELKVFDKLTCDGHVISSTHIRHLIKAGEIEDAMIELGEPFFIEGSVLHGQALGRTIGFPTINMEIRGNKIIPPNGVYAARVIIDGREYRGMSNLGNKPTVGKFGINLETNIFDFDEDVYGRPARVMLTKFIRPEQKFSGIGELTARLKADKEEIMKVC
ncbi:MAG: bifunctional riboflavin kinase/FAD synthetase [Lachnospiraceae bacterium]|jgi:riboflavin kinase/FMN adenylyltransferase|nr:bifunctional riboflavin kinase/FAD synthetase [Lachnospiraceae bacterium]MEE3460692.1 bifunctional riboflavin kinase/FAD synthetase [Lachnospiraceae bacterium]